MNPQKYIIFLITIIIIFILFSKNINEGYDNWDWRLFNMNWNKPWKNPEVAYNNPYYQDLPNPTSNDSNFPDYQLNIVNENYLKSVLSKMVSTGGKPISNIGKVYNDISFPKYYALNKKSWYKNINDQTENNMKQTDIVAVNNILTHFIKEFNTKFSRLPHYGNEVEFKILKYRVNVINKNQYGLIVVIVRKDNYNGTVLYLDYVDNSNNVSKNYDLLYYDIIGYYKTDRLYLLDGFDKNKNFYELNPLYRISKRDKTLNEYLNDNNWQYLNVNYSNANDILWKQEQYQYDNTLQHQPTCFNKEPEYYNPSPDTNGKNTILNFVYNKTNCESKYDNFGRRKPRGLWDTPCLTDEECPFYMRNKNYPNSEGKCNKETGFCELPQGMQHLGYHYYHPFASAVENKDNLPVCNIAKKYGDGKGMRNNGEPLCYNCRSVVKNGKWNAMTKMDTCCNEQNSKKLYPYLDGPDYAFFNDMQQRLTFSRE